MVIIIVGERVHGIRICVATNLYTMLLELGPYIRSMLEHMTCFFFLQRDLTNGSIWIKVWPIVKVVVII
jgi:hypothetical protein